MTKKRPAKPKKEAVNIDLENLPGYRLILQRVKATDTQLSFAELMGGWSALPDPIIAMQHERLVTEIAELDCRTGIIFVDRGVTRRGSGSGTLVVVNDDEAHIILPPQFDKKWSKKQLKDILKIVLTIEDVLGFKTYDPQLGREIDIRTDLREIRAYWASMQVKE